MTATTRRPNPISCRRIFRTTLIAVLLAMLSLTGASAQATVKLSGKQTDITRWVKEHFRKNTVPPFSFVMDGKHSGDFIRSWNLITIHADNIGPATDQYIFRWIDKKTKMMVECHLFAYKDAGAVEWKLRFRNTAKENSPVITDIKAVDISIDGGRDGDFILYYADGSHASKADFHPREKRLGAGESHYMSPAGGRSSDHAFPFFNIAAPESNGVMVAIGWSGEWYADVVRNGGRSVSLASGMKEMELFLYPDEAIHSPSVCLLFWEGEDRMAGHNRFRRFVLDHQTRIVNGRRAVYPISSGFNFGDPPPCNEYTCLTEEYAVAMVKRYAQFGLVPEVFWLDAGWYAGAADAAGRKNWGNTVGNWEPDKTRFPRGLKPVADEIHRLGAKFMVWFEPERVIKGTLLAEQHPQWMLDIGNDTYLFDLGDRKACRWLCEYIGDMLEEQGIDYYRQDFNMDPAPYWQKYDEPGRKGIKEIRHIEGLYEFWDYLLDRFPDLIIDNCASGGRRIDLETTKRSASLWRTDYHYGEPVGYQCHTYGLNFYLPLSGTGTLKTDDFTFRSSLGTAVIYNWKITDAAFNINDMQACLAEFRDMRPYFYEDYYPLTGIDDMTGDDIWLAYQLHRPSDDTGAIVAFRREKSPDSAITVKLSGLTPATVYEFTDSDSGEIRTFTGEQAAKGMELRLENPRSSAILKYKPKTE